MDGGYKPRRARSRGVEELRHLCRSTGSEPAVSRVGHRNEAQRIKGRVRDDDRAARRKRIHKPTHGAVCGSVVRFEMQDRAEQHGNRFGQVEIGAQEFALQDRVSG